MCSFIILIVFTASFTTIFTYFPTQQAIAQTQSAYLEKLKILLSYSIQPSQKGDNNSALVHLKLADQQIPYIVQSSTNTNRIEQNMNATTKKIAFSTYKNPTVGITLQYPSDWIKNEYPYNPASNNTIVSFFSQSESASALGNVSGVSGNFVPYVDVFVFTEANNVSLDEVVDQAVNNFDNNSTYVDVSKPITLEGNIPAHVLVYDNVVASDEHFKKMQVWASSGDKVYVLTYTSEASLYSTYLPIIQKMIQSLELNHSQRQTTTSNSTNANNSSSVNSHQQKETSLTDNPIVNRAELAGNATIAGVPWLP